jgi:hypothetical protein
MRGSVFRWLCPLALLFTVSACTNPYDPAQRAIGGGLLGAGAGAAIGAAAGGGHGAALGAAIGGVTGVIAGIATTPPPPHYYGGTYHPRRYTSARRRHARCVEHCPQAASQTAPQEESGY